jgi:DNA-directed RNA polymerase subunit RPC12/RpoP
MSRPSPPRVRSWDDPECPNCESDVFVRRRVGGVNEFPYECELCGEIFDTESDTDE